MIFLADKLYKRALQPVLSNSFKRDLGGIKWVHRADRMVRSMEITYFLM